MVPTLARMFCASELLMDIMREISEASVASRERVSDVGNASRLDTVLCILLQ